MCFLKKLNTKCKANRKCIYII